MEKQNQVPNPPFDENPNKTNSFWKELLIFILIAVFIVLPFRYFVAEPYIVNGTSMSPTFQTGNYLIVDKISWKLHKPSRYDVVVMKFPDPNKDNPTKDFIKRIIGLPTETVLINQGIVTIINNNNPDGFVLDQSFVKYTKDETMSINLKEDEYFVMGDNRDGSFDSRYWGPLPAKDIIGRPVIRLLPFSKISLIPGSFIPETPKK